MYEECDADCEKLWSRYGHVCRLACSWDWLLMVIILVCWQKYAIVAGNVHNGTQASTAYLRRRSGRAACLSVPDSGFSWQPAAFRCAWVFEPLYRQFCKFSVCQLLELLFHVWVVIRFLLRMHSVFCSLALTYLLSSRIRRVPGSVNSYWAVYYRYSTSSSFARFVLPSQFHGFITQFLH